MARRIRVHVPLLLLTISGALAATSAAVELLDQPDARWRQGPVKYILTKDEDAQFRKLKTDEERKAFVDQFWQKRDPSPGTPANEFKEAYARRLSLVDEKFAAPEGRGWEEDRGKVVLLLGAPDEVEVRQSPAAGSGPSSDSADQSDSATRKKVTFTYKREIVPGAPVPLKLEFAQESSGGYRLLSRFDSTHPRLTGLEPVPIAVAPAPAASPEPAAAPPAPTEPPAPATPQQALMEEVLASPSPTAKIPLAARLDYYKTSEAETLATLTVAVQRPASAEPLILAARVVKPEAEPVLRLEKDTIFTPAPENASAAPGSDLVFQAGHNIEPGTYALVAAAKDPLTGDVGFVQQSIEVPSFRQETLQISSVTLAKKVERIAAPGSPTRFILGNFRVVPAPRAQFRAGDDVWIYYQIYNTASDPNTGQPKLKTTYRYEKVEKAANRLLGGRPVEQNTGGTVQSYAVTVQPQWPAGNYQIVVKVEDLVAGTSASATVPFSVVK